MSEKVNFRLPEELIDKADVAAKISHKNRTEIIKEAVVELYLEDEINFDILKQFIGRQDAESVKASKTLLNQGDDLADELAQL